MAAVLPSNTATPVGGTSKYFDTDALVDGSAPKVANSAGFFNAAVAANHVRFAASSGPPSKTWLIWIIRIKVLKSLRY